MISIKAGGISLFPIIDSNATTKHICFKYIMTKKHYKIQSQKGYWFEALSLFTDECLTKEEIEEYKHELAQRLADLVKHHCVLDDVSNSVYCDCDNPTKYTDANNKTYCKWCGKDLK